VRDYVETKIVFLVPGQVLIDMMDNIESTVNTFSPEKFESIKFASPWNENLFKIISHALHHQKNKQKCFIISQNKIHLQPSM